MKIIFVLQILFLHNVCSCRFSKIEDEMECLSILDASAEGTDQWDKLSLFNNNIQIHMKRETFKRTPNLVDLTIGNITSIETGAFSGLNKLSKLSIYQSELEKVPIGVLNNLPIRNLFIHNGVLEKIEDKSFENMNDLYHLGLYGNLLESFNCEQYIGASYSLTSLWLNRNKLTKVTKDMFTTVPNLIYLYLELNQIEFIEPESFHKIPLLTSIDISNNKLQQLHPNIFLPLMKNLNYISVQNNRLTFINKAFFLRTLNLKYIAYGGNPFQCPCSEELDSLIGRKGVTKVCDKDYYKGDRPSCVITTLAPKECIYDEIFTSELFELFQKALIDYPKLELKCVTSNGIENAFLYK